MSSKQKGKRGELEVVHLLHRRFMRRTVDRPLFKCHRAVQYKGTKESSDIVCNDPDRIAIEVTRNQSVRPGTKAMVNKLAKAANECVPAGELDPVDWPIPVVFWRPDGDKSWRVVCCFVIVNDGSEDGISCLRPCHPSYAESMERSYVLVTFSPAGFMDLMGYDPVAESSEEA